MKKRGLSDIVMAVLMVLLVIVATGIVWVIVRNMISESSEEAELGKLTVNLDVKSVKFEGDVLKVTVKRNAGEGKVLGLKFLVSDGENSEVFEENTAMPELAEQEFDFDLTGLGFDSVREISVTPVLGSDNEKEILGDVSEKHELTDWESLGYGRISWWKFDEGGGTTAYDEVGDNDGTIYGADCTVQGRFGKACSFDGNDDYIDTSDSDSFDFAGGFSLCALANPTYTDASGRILYRYDLVSKDGYYLTQSNSGSGVWDFTVFINPSYKIVHSSSVPTGDWQHICGVRDDNGNLFLYVDGVLDSGTENIPGAIDSNDGVRIGIDISNFNDFDGIIDEVMIYDRALSEDEIKILSNADLS